MDLVWAAAACGKHLSEPVARQALADIDHDDTAARVLAHPDVDVREPWAVNALTCPRLGGLLERLDVARTEQVLAVAPVALLLEVLQDASPADRPHPALVEQLATRAGNDPAVALQLLPYLRGAQQAAAVLASAVDASSPGGALWAAAAVNHPHLHDQLAGVVPAWCVRMLTGPDPAAAFLAELTAGRWGPAPKDVPGWPLRIVAASGQAQVADTALARGSWLVSLRRYVADDPRFADLPVGARARTELADLVATMGIDTLDTFGAILRTLGACGGEQREVDGLWQRLLVLAASGGDAQKAGALRASDIVPGRALEGVEPAWARLAAQVAAQIACQAAAGGAVQGGAVALASGWLASDAARGDRAGQGWVQAPLTVAAARATGAPGLLAVAWPTIVQAAAGVGMWEWMLHRLADSWAGSPAGVDAAFTSALVALADDFTGTLGDLLASATAIAS